MKVIIIEDEISSAKRLAKLITSVDESIEILARLDSIESTVKYLQTEPLIDLIFMDIQLADGLCFTIFEQVNITTPVIFTTAFDKYTLKAFKVNSVDYLLKPIDEEELSVAIEKYNQIHKKDSGNEYEKIAGLLNDLGVSKYKDRFIIKRGKQISFIKTEDIACLYASGKLCYIVDNNNQKFLAEDNLSNLAIKLNPKTFYRINRTMILNIAAIKNTVIWLGGRLKIELHIPTSEDTIVSRERVGGFKEWLDGE
ncbi:MAG: LytTR family DNA-binding domain-containing protein [Bacteroidota bacterium]